MASLPGPVRWRGHDPQGGKAISLVQALQSTKAVDDCFAQWSGEHAAFKARQKSQA